MQVGRYNAILHKLLAMKEGAPAPTLAPDILPVLVLESDRPEWAYLGGVALASAGAERAGVALQVAHLQIFNPVGSGALVIVNELVLASDNSAVIQWGVTPTAMATNETVGGAADTRLLSPIAVRNVAAQIRSDSTVGLLGMSYTLGTIRVITNQGIVIPQDVVLAPGTGLLVSNRAIAALLQVTFIWRERAFEPSEVR